MGVTVMYHFGGTFGMNGSEFDYNGGEVASIVDVDPDMISVFDLRRGLKSKASSMDTTKMDYKVPFESGVDSFRIIANDDHVNMLMETYADKEVYDIYVQDGVEGTDGRLAEESDSDSGDSDFDVDAEDQDDTDDSDFEVGGWVSEEDREDAEMVGKKVKEIKEKLKKGVPFLCNHNGDGYESDGNGSEEAEYLEEPDSDDEMGQQSIRRKSPYPRYNKNTDKPYFKTTMTFGSMNEVRGAIRKHGLTERKDLRYIKNESNRIRLVCKWEGCQFLFYVAVDHTYNMLQLKNYVPHVCPEHYRNKFVSRKFIAEYYKQRIKSNPRWKNKHMVETIREDFGADVTRMQCSRAKSLVLRTTFPAYKEEYGLLRTYAEEILRVSPDSTVKIMVDTDNPTNEPYFNRMYVCFDSLKKGFLAGCRRVIAMDGCFVKGLCKGELLTAIGRDANDQMYPIAWCVVEVECRASWDWFLDHLQADLDIGRGAGWCFSTDQQKVRHFFKMPATFCVRGNWRKKYRDPGWQKMFWNCAKASNEALFFRMKDELSAKNAEAAEAMLRIDPQKWRMAYFTADVKCDSVDNNMSESFNALILEARHKPILSMLEDIRIYCMEQIVVKRAIAICPKILRKLSKNAKAVCYCHIVGNGKEGYEVRHRHGDKYGSIVEDRYRVQLDDWTCSCRAWQLTGVPCCHAITCVIYEGKDPQDYITGQILEYI